MCSQVTSPNSAGGGGRSSQPGTETDAWWAARGADYATVRSSWRFTSRADFEAVLRMEFPLQVADPWLAARPGALGLSYSYSLHSIDKPDGLLRARSRVLAP